MTLADLKGKTAGVCVSGGLDSRTISKVLVEAGVNVIAFSADVGQPDEKDINDIRKRMAPCGVDTVIVDLKNEMAEACFEAIEAQAMYDGGYWNSTGIARAVTVRGLIPEMKKRKCTVLIHGATGRGNDQMRFERYTNVLAPTMRVYSPWRDAELLKRFPGRTQMVEFLAKYGIKAFVGTKKKYSTDSNLAGLSHEAEDLESMETSMLIVKPTMGVWPQEAPNKIERFTVRFEKARAVQINGKDVTPLEAMLLANAIGGRNGIGMKHALENRIIGTKSRGVYEAPGMEVLATALRYLYQATMDRRATLLFMQLSKLVADQIYDGRYYDPATQAARAAIGVFAKHATGTVEVGLYKGNIFFTALTGCKATIYNEADSSMEASNGLNPVSSQGFAEIQSVEALMLAKAKQIVSK
ncbi:MAG: argininosuccinate synthase [Kiritimatiellae bacterium]|nr:argininosuccinate synthase [Kiritimatiellia bacterium]